MPATTGTNDNACDVTRYVESKLNKFMVITINHVTSSHKPCDVITINHVTSNSCFGRVLALTFHGRIAINFEHKNKLLSEHVSIK